MRARSERRDGFDLIDSAVCLFYDCFVDNRRSQIRDCRRQFDLNA
jgi:hypothetical protein